MTVKELIDIVDGIKPNQYGIEEKVRWLSFVEHTIINDVIMAYEGYEGQYDDFEGYSPDKLDVPLIVKPPHDRLYEAYLKMKIDEENGETARYNNSATMYNTYLMDYKKWYNKHRMVNCSANRRTSPSPSMPQTRPSDGGISADVAKEFSDRIAENRENILKLRQGLSNEVAKREREYTEGKREIAVERARINAFTTLKEGSTTGDAELIDARVGSDGIEHANVGEHIRYISEEIAPRTYNLYDRKKATQNAYQTSGTYGTITNIESGDSYYNKGYVASHNINVDGIEELYVNNLRNYNFVNEYGMKVEASGDATINTGKAILKVPSGAKNVRFTINEKIDGNFLCCIGNEEKAYVPYRVINKELLFEEKGTHDLKIAFVGDSITWGYNDDVDEQVEMPYPTIIKNEYGFADCYNLGISGTTVGGDGNIHDSKQIGSKNNFLSRLDEIPSDSDIICVFGGTNDFGVESYYVPLGEYGDATSLTFYGSLEILFTSLIDAFVGRKIFYITPLHRMTETKTADGITRNLSEYVNAIRMVANKYGVELIDLYASGEFFAMNAKFRELYSTSGLHPNQAWYHVLARKIGDYIIAHLH